MTLAQREHLRRRATPTAGMLRRGFTMVEIVVVIGIIVLLAALVLSFAPGLAQQSERRETGNVLQLMDMAMKEWQREADRSLSWGQDGQPFPESVYEIQYDMDPEEASHVALERLLKHPAAKDIITQIDPDFLEQHEESPGVTELHLHDAWGGEVYMIHPGPVSRNDAGAIWPFITGSPRLDEDGTLLVEDASVPGYGWEQTYGVCKSRQPLFVSAGPDGKFGEWDAAAGTPEHDALQDNVYSYPPEAWEAP